MVQGHFLASLGATVHTVRSPLSNSRCVPYIFGVKEVISRMLSTARVLAPMIIVCFSWVLRT